MLHPPWRATFALLWLAAAAHFVAGCGSAPRASHRGYGLLQSAEGGVRASRKPHGTPARRPASFLAVPKSRVVSTEGFSWPLKGGSVSSFYGVRDGSFHEGLDLRSPSGTGIYSAREGVVIYSGRGIRGYGNVVILRHKGGLASVYAHNRKNLVRRGQTVKRGALIAYVGATGHATGPHLHFEVRREEVPQDPLLFLPLGNPRVYQYSQLKRE